MAFILHHVFVFDGLDIWAMYLFFSEIGASAVSKITSPDCLQLDRQP